MKRITYKSQPATLCWLNRERNTVSSWTGYYNHEEHPPLAHYSFGYHFDAAISSEDGEYAVVFHKTGTKGLLLKQGKILREINRSYYQAEVYEYPVAFAFLLGRTYLVHCPIDYCRIDLEDAETGKIVTDVPGRDPKDFFHSRLEVSPDNKTLISRGWAWHPFDYIEAFDLEAALSDPLILDSGRSPKVPSEICTGSFIDNNRVLIGTSGKPQSSEENSAKMGNNSIAVWDIVSNEVTGIVKADFKIGAHLEYIAYNLAWELFSYPKIIDITTGKVLDEIRDIDSGEQISSLIFETVYPKVAFNKKTKQIAIATGETVEVLTNDLLPE